VSGKWCTQVSILDRDPYSRILKEYEDGTVRVYFRIPKEVFIDLIDITDFLGASSIDEGLKLAVQALQEKVFDKKTVIKLKRFKRKPHKRASDTKTIKEIKDMISFLTKLISNINENISRVERLSSLVSSPTVTQQPRAERSSYMDIDLGELKAKTDTTAPVKSIEKSLEEAIEDVLVVAIADEILQEKDKENNA